MQVREDGRPRFRGANAGRLRTEPSESIQPVGVGIGWVERMGCEFDGPARGDGLQGMGDTRFDAGEVAGVQIEGDALPVGRVLGEERHGARDEVEGFAFALVDVMAADAAGLEFEDGQVMDGLVAVAELREFALGQAETFADWGVGGEGDGEDRQGFDGQPSGKELTRGHGRLGGGDDGRTGGYFIRSKVF